jgi:hypothetical protein
LGVGLGEGLGAGYLQGVSFSRCRYILFCGGGGGNRVRAG